MNKCFLKGIYEILVMANRSHLNEGLLGRHKIYPALREWLENLRSTVKLLKTDQPSHDTAIN